MNLPLALNAEAYQRVLESLPLGVYLVDRERRILFWNDGCEQITGYLRHEVIGRRCADNLLMHCDEANDSMCGSACPLQATMHDGEPRRADVFLRHKDGQRVPVRIRAVPLRDEHGAVIGACESFDERVARLPVGNDVLPAVPREQDLGVQLPDFAAVLWRLQAELVEFRSSRIPFGVLCLAIDDLERLRGADGIPAVTRLLDTTAETLARCIGPGNVVGPWPQDRFVVILRACSDKTLLDSAIVLKRLAGLDAVPWWGGRLTVTWSAGGTVAKENDSPDILIRRAEDALHAATVTGGGQAKIV